MREGSTIGQCRTAEATYLEWDMGVKLRVKEDGRQDRMGCMDACCLGAGVRRDTWKCNWNNSSLQVQESVAQTTRTYYL